MAGKVVNPKFVFSSKFGASRQESASKSATNHTAKRYHTFLKERQQL
jgi:hypothetical protein